ncbi:LysM peptidoglycan-binding domain-containing protein [Sutcliffiella horikoshii]|uniref:LysM peptidoglycan-binding domain-containing protein n=1 Tax=Sutcliffiella horikoshii TaxID=79883 RepID=A0A5D4T5E1_9BACI|nr:peptidoglycan endopeptidase [Sutcliffiella horikoshii]TYS70927.1 LysM peptidoglycan-binding domain-containing protein [Sutcliffiella horikoshii]
MKKKVMAGALVTSIMFSGQAYASDYVVKSGDSLWKIANNNQVSVSNIKSWNNLNSDLIFPGQKLVLKAGGSAVQTAPAPTPSQPTSITYTIKSGDSLSMIAKNHQTNIANLLKLNPSITDVNKIYVGQKINVAAPSSQTPGQPVTPTPSPSQPEQPKTNTYTIKSGDNLSSVASRHGVTLNALLSANPSIKDANRISIGQVINIPGNAASNPGADSAWDSKADAIIETGKKYLGAKYLYGASTNRTDAFDCSSFTVRVFAENGINLPRTSAQQGNVGKEIPLSEIRKGDLVFFDTEGDGVINHVSIVTDPNTLLHAATSTGVAFSSYNTYWKPRAVKAVRVL